MGVFQKGLWFLNLAVACCCNQTQVLPSETKSHGDLRIFTIYNIKGEYRFLLASGSMSEPSLINIAGVCHSNLSGYWCDSFQNQSLMIFTVFWLVRSAGYWQGEDQCVLQKSIPPERVPPDPQCERDCDWVIYNLLYFLKILKSSVTVDNSWSGRTHDQTLGFLLPLAATGFKVQVCLCNITYTLLEWTVFQWASIFRSLWRRCSAWLRPAGRLYYYFNSCSLPLKQLATC